MILPWFYAFIGGDDEKKDKDVLDVSLLGDDDLVEAGVTSGSDPSVWQPIDVDKKPDGS